MYETVLDLVDASIDSFTNQEITYDEAAKVNSLEASVDQMQESFEQLHINRLNDRSCDTKASMLFVNTITDFERVGDHATNIAWAVFKKPD